jgi:hypothetical protein
MSNKARSASVDTVTAVFIKLSCFCIYINFPSNNSNDLFARDVCLVNACANFLHLNLSRENFTT